MLAVATPPVTSVTSVTSGGSVASAVAAWTTIERDEVGPGVAIPRPEGSLVVRFGASVRGGFDVHAMGGRKVVGRKLIPPGLVVSARFHLGGAQAVLGVPAPVLAGRTVALEELWGAAATRRLYDRLAAARGRFEAAHVLERAIAERLSTARAPRASLRLVRDAASRLASDPVNVVADALGISERHLRRLFHEAVGVGPKQFARITRFHRAVAAVRSASAPSWARIAVGAGYYDQAHLIAEFRALAGVTPQSLLAELRVAQSIG